MFGLKKKMFFVSLFFVLVFLLFAVPLVQAATVVVNYTSDGNFTIPTTVTQITVEAWGGGGGGGGGGTGTKDGGGGGAGGQYATANIAVTAGQIFNITIGTGGTGGASPANGTSGRDTYFYNLTGNYTLAKGGNFGRALGSGGARGIGSASGGVGTTIYAGGTGGTGTTSLSGGGGGGAGSTGVGGNASGVTAGTGTTELGGNGGAGSTANNGNGNPGNLYGGGGAGQTDNVAGERGGNGSVGILRITYIITDTIYPIFSSFNSNPENNTPYSSGATYRFNSTIINTNGTAGMEFNGTNNTATNSSNNFTASVTNLAAGTYSYYWWARGNGTDKNFNSTTLMSYTVAKATQTLTFLANGGTNNLSLIYPQQVNISATASAGTGTVGLDKDNANYLSSNSLNVSLSAGSYIFRANITGNQNYSNVDYSYYNITINKTIPQGSLTNTTAWTVTYPTQTNISYSESNSGDGDVSYNISRDNVYKNGGENVTLGVGTYNYVLNTTGGTNYTANASMDAKTLTVQQNNSYVLTLTITPSITETYPTQINATGTNCPSELTCNLYNNQTGTLTNGANYTLGAGVYNITYNTTGNTNYSAKSVSQIVTINKATPAGSLTNTTSLTVTYPTAINVSYVETNTGDADVSYKIYRDNVDVTSEKGLNVTLSAGTYSYILNSTGGANYSTNASISNFTITVAQATPVITKLLNSGTDNLTITYPQQVNATGSSTGGTIKIYRDTTDATSENGLNVSLSAGGYVYNFNVTGNTNYSSVAGEYMQVNISKATSSVNLTLNNSESNITIIQGTAINLNCSTLTGDSGTTLTLYREGSVINSGTSPIGNTTTFSTVQVENITCIYSNSQNYTTSSETWFVHVNAANTCTCAGLNNNWEINMADYCVISTTCNLGTGNITFTGTGNATFNSAISFKNLEYPTSGQTLFIGSNAVIRVG